MRPLNYRGRFMEGLSTKSNKEFTWKNAPLWREGRTELATQLHTKDMVMIETPLEDQPRGVAISAPEGEEHLFGGARKVEQIGQNACEKLLLGMMTDLQMTGDQGCSSLT